MGSDNQSSFPAIEIGQVLRDRYVIEGRLGSGATGTVYQALDRYRADLPENKQRIALKILHQSADNHALRLAELRREFYRTQALSHPNIIQVYELDRDGDVDFFTMELLTGELLGDITRRMRNSPMARAYAWKIIHEIGSGLSHAHARQVVHADFKPRNIMITHTGELRILDFGASAASADGAAGPARQETVRSEATSSYASCELLDGRSADPRDDIYAFACIAYELLAGAHPFQGRPSTVARDLGIVPQRPPGLAWRQWRALAAGLSWHRAGRSVTVAACIKNLNAGRGMAGQLPALHELRPAPARPRPATSLKAATLYAALPIAAGVGVLLLARPGPTEPRDTPPPTTRGESTSVSTMSVPTAMVTSAPTAAVPIAPVRPAAAPTPVASAVPHEANRLSAPVGAPPPTLMFAEDYTVRAGDRFVEIRVHRGSRSDADNKFVWWTEAATARPGIDYVQQGKVTQIFPKGKRSASFFIKLIPSAARAQSQVFYFAIAAAGRGAAPGPVARAAIRLPTTHASILARTLE